MSNSIFPVEILEFIIEYFISKFRDTYKSQDVKYKYTPYWQHHLIPVLRVCKYWHMVSEKIMYRRVSLGSDFFSAAQRQWCWPEGKVLCITKDLLATLMTNFGIAALVKELRLAIYDVRGAEALECTTTNFHILKLCPNVKHVEVTGFQHSESDALVEVLGEKSESLVSLHISPRGLLTQNPHSSSFKVLELMHSLPRLRTIVVNGFPSFAEWTVTNDPNAQTPPPGPANYGPDLQDIRRIDCNLHCSDLESLLNMSDHVRSLSFVMRHGSGSEALLEGLCKCLHGWSRTLERFSLNIDRQFVSYRPLHEALSTLEGLRQLEVIGTLSYFSAVADLPSLERIRFKTDAKIKRREMDDFAANLKKLAKFPSLKYVGGGSRDWSGYNMQLRDICSGRGINLVTNNHKNYIPSYLC